MPAQARRRGRKWRAHLGVFAARCDPLTTTSAYGDRCRCRKKWPRGRCAACRIPLAVLPCAYCPGCLVLLG